MEQISINASGSKGYIKKIGNDFRIMANSKASNGFELIPIPYITLMKGLPAALECCIFDGTSTEINYDETVDVDSNNSDIFSIYKGVAGLNSKHKYIFNIKIRISQESNNKTLIDITIYKGKLNSKTNFYIRHKVSLMQPEYIYLNNNEVIELCNNINDMFKLAR